MQIKSYRASRTDKTVVKITMIADSDDDKLKLAKFLKLVEMWEHNSQVEKERQQR